MSQSSYEETQNIHICPYLTEMISILGSGISYYRNMNKTFNKVHFHGSAWF